MNPTDLPSLRETLDAHGLLAKKAFGQHFLLDLNVTRKIVRLAGIMATARAEGVKGVKSASASE